jgi:UDP-N-acetylmuramyl tripeptide synthase
VSAARGRELPQRARAAVLATRAVNRVSRRLGAGSGTVAGGRAGLAVDARLLERLAAGRHVALVSGTNGKTTTTRLLAVAIEGRLGRAASNSTGSNMPTGHVTALVDAPVGAPAVLEVDEGYLPQLVGSLRPGVVVLLNLSRDQLDRTNEVRIVAARWRAALARAGDGSGARPDGAERAGPAAAAPVVVANADDPLVSWAAAASQRPVWVGAGLSWRADAVGCPACDGTISFSTDPRGGWSCTCGFCRPSLDVWLEEGVVCFAGGRRIPVQLELPGRFNLANAAMAAAAASALGVDAGEALARIATVGEVAGRFGTAQVDGRPVRLMLAKNPAGWRELLDLLRTAPRRPLVVGINARVADGRDPSWLWDVPFESLAGRFVVATGERCRDLSVRLRYAGVQHEAVRDPLEAVTVAARRPAPGPSPGGAVSAVDGAVSAVDYVGNYTAFYDLLARAGKAVPGLEELLGPKVGA